MFGKMTTAEHIKNFANEALLKFGKEICEDRLKCKIVIACRALLIKELHALKNVDDEKVRKSINMKNLKIIFEKIFMKLLFIINDLYFMECKLQGFQIFKFVDLRKISPAFCRTLYNQYETKMAALLQILIIDIKA